MAAEMTLSRHTFGLEKLDDLLGGGVLPGKLCVVLGATGIGKTQLGLHYLHQGLQEEKTKGVIYDLTSRGDSQSHIEYAKRLYNWELTAFSNATHKSLDIDPEAIWNEQAERTDISIPFVESHRRVTYEDLTEAQQREWKKELNQKLSETIRFFYGNIIHGVRRCVVDGVEPVVKPSHSFQHDVFHYIEHQILRKAYDWVARDLFRQKFRGQLQQIESHKYNYEDLSCLLLCTTQEIMLDDLLNRPLPEGDVLANANTVVAMGKLKEGTTLKRGLAVIKHRGSACGDDILTYSINEQGLQFD